MASDRRGVDRTNTRIPAERILARGQPWRWDLGNPSISSLYAFTSYLNYREGRLPNLVHALSRPAASPEPLLHRPSLMCPSSATGVWKAEIREYFPEVSLFLYYDNKQRALPEDQKSTLTSNIAAFRPWMKELNPTHPATSRVLVLTIYLIWCHRTVAKETV